MLEKDINEHDDEFIPEAEAEIEDVDEVEAETFTKDKLTKLRKQLEESEKEKRDHLEELQRAKADFLNSKRRLEEQLERDKERTSEKFICELLPLVDSFEMASQNSDAWEKADPTWKKGMEGIYNQLMSILKTHGVTEIETLGQSFNPELHEAVSNEVMNDKKKVDTVIKVLQKGFERKGTIIRPARVVVGIEG